jgi:DNA-binding response OmpR family regulator
MQAGLQPPDLIILDLGLPDGDGIDLTREIRSWSSVPIIVLSARGHEQDKVAALDAGADDYLTKPFGVGELTARIRVALRHASAVGGTDADPVYIATIDDRTLRVDLSARLVHVADARGEQEVRLTPSEFKLLAFLVKHAGKVLTHQEILREVWGPPTPPTSSTCASKAVFGVNRLRACFASGLRGRRFKSQPLTRRRHKRDDRPWRYSPELERPEGNQGRRHVARSLDPLGADRRIQG